ncbi:HIRAN domain-containing protein [Parabacteroides goldsteinii]
MNVLVIIIVVVTVFVVIRAYALRNDEQRKQVRSEIADRIEERDNLNVEVQPKEEPQYNYYSFNVVGMKYCPVSTKKFIDRMTGGETVELVPEPRNRYDKNAIKVMAYDHYKMKDIRIGYVPADETLEIRKIMDENPCLDCTIDFINCDLDDDYFSISVEIKY